jgi:predicted permease
LEFWVWAFLNNDYSALIYLLYVVILKQNSEMIEVAIMESAMAPMITASILATTHGLKPRLSSMMIGLESLFLLSHWLFGILF